MVYVFYSYQEEFEDFKIELYNTEEDVLATMEEYRNKLDDGEIMLYQDDSYNNVAYVNYKGYSSFFGYQVKELKH